MNLIFTQIQYLPIQKYAITFFVGICLISDFNISMSFQLFLHWGSGVFFLLPPCQQLMKRVHLFQIPSALHAGWWRWVGNIESSPWMQTRNSMFQPLYCSSLRPAVLPRLASGAQSSPLVLSRWVHTIMAVSECVVGNMTDKAYI